MWLFFAYDEGFKDVLVTISDMDFLLGLMLQ